MTSIIKFWHHFLVGQFTLYGGSGGGGGPTTSTTQTSNVPEYARPYVETMLGATQQQLFNTKQTGGTPATYDSEGNQTSPGTPGGTEITGVKPYVPFSSNPNDYVAGFSPMQQQSFKGVAGMQVPGQFGAGSDITGQAAQGSLGASGQVGGLQNQALGYGAAGAQFGGAGAEYGAQGAEQAQQAAALTAAQAARYGAQGSRAGQQAAGLSGLYGNLGAQAGERYAGQSTGYGGAAAGLAPQAQGYGQQAANAGNQYAQQATNPYATQAYMSPYMQNVVDVQNREARRNAQIVGAQQQAEATRAGGIWR